MWCPSVSLSVWANAWLAGVAAPDDVLDALSQWAPRHSVTAYDAVAAGQHRPALAGHEPLGDHVAAADAADRGGHPRSAPLRSPSCCRYRAMSAGLPAGTQFQRDAVTVGEAILIDGGPRRHRRSAWFPTSNTTTSTRPTTPTAELSGLSWTVYSMPGAPIAEHLDLGEAEFALRSAVRSAADALGAIRAEAGGVDVADPRKLVEQVMESSGLHRAPDHAPSRALRVLENAAHIDAIVTVSCGIDADRPAEFVGGADRQRCAAPAGGGGALGPAGRGERDPPVGVALGLAAVRRAERSVDRKAIQRRGIRPLPACRLAALA